MKNWTVSWSFFLSTSAAAFFTNFVFFRYFWNSMLRVADPSGYFAMNASSSALSNGLFFRMAQAISAPERSTTSGWSLTAGRTLAQKRARKSSTTTYWTRPALVISSRSSSSRVSGANRNCTAGLPRFARSAFNFSRLSW